MDFLYNFWSFEKVYSSTFDCAAVYGQRCSQHKTAPKKLHDSPCEPEPQITVFIYIYNALYVRRRSRWALCTHFRIKRKFLGGDYRWLKNFRYFLWACSPEKYTSQVHFWLLKWEMVKNANLGITDLGDLEVWDRSGMIQASTLAGLECHRTIGAVQTRIPEIVNRDCQNSLYSSSLVNALRGLHALQGWF